MSNNPPKNFVELVQRLRQIAAGVDSLLAGGGSWAGPAAADLRNAADSLEVLVAETDSAYSAYKQKMSARDAHSNDRCEPIFRECLRAAHLKFGKTSEQLRDFGFLPRSAPSARRILEPPAGVSIREATATSVILDWSPVSGAKRYHVYCGTDMNKMALYGSSTASKMKVSGLSEGVKYYFYVRTVTSAGESAHSNFATGRTA